MPYYNSNYYLQKIKSTEDKIAEIENQVGHQKVEEGDGTLEIRNLLDDYLKLLEYYERKYNEALSSEKGTKVTIMNRYEYGGIK